MSDPLSLSVVTPSYNTAPYLAAAIQSVLDQDWPAVDYRVMDGGSTDGTLAILQSFGSRLQWVSQKDKGQSDAINKGFAMSSGDVLAWLNSDDTYAPGAFRTAMEYLQTHPDVAMVYGDADYIDPAGNLIAPCTHIEPFSYHRLLHYTDFIVQPTAFFRRSAFEAVGGVDVSLHWGMDYDLFLKIARRFKVAYIPKLLAHFRWLADNKTATGGRGRLNEITRIVAGQGAGRPAYIRLEYVNLDLQDARKSLRDGQPLVAARHFASATAQLLASPRAMLSMLQPHTWRIIYTGQVLRARSMKTWSVPSK